MEEEILSGAVGPLLCWYREHRRDLPWRKERTFYSVLLSELMLQQTRVEAVKERYTRFLERFPTVESLAAASEDEVLKNWEGLGYYSRARNLHKAAKIIAERGEPRTWVGVRALPGVGDYTAGAISSIALGLKEPAVDGNVLRILTRLLADGRNIDESTAKKHFSDLLRKVYPPETADFTEALMELGAIVCVPNGPPMCGACPWESCCKAHLAGREGEFPVREKKKPRRRETLDVFIFRAGDRYALRKRGAGLLNGLWEFPNSPAGGEIPCGKVLEKKCAKHIFTHVEWQMTGYLIEAEEDPQYIWATASEIRERFAIPSAFKAFMEWIK